MTGTIGNYRYTSEDNTRFKEETEPLGQTISLQDTADAPTPINGGPVGRADDPEWQCQAPREFYGSFSALPEHCQMSILRSLDGMKDIYGISTKKQSPKYINININKIRSPTVGGDGSEKMMSYALSSTTKKTGSDGEDETIRIETHVPKLPDDIERRVSAEFGGEDDFTTSEAIDLAETALKETRCKDLFILQGITPAELLKSKNVKINFKDLSNRHLS